MWRIFSSLIVICFCVQNIVTVNDVIIDQSLLKSGFHRTLVTNITLYGNLSSCRLLAEEKFTKNFFITQEDLDEFDKTNFVDSKLSPKISVEAIASESPPFSVFVYLNNSQPVTTSAEFHTTYLYELPVHIRYHEPKSGGNFREFKKGPIVFYALCPSGLTIPKGTTSKLPCNATSTDHCEWVAIGFTQKSLLPTLLVPVGNTDVFQYVCASTHVAAYLGLFVIIYKLLSVKIF